MSFDASDPRSKLPTIEAPEPTALAPAMIYQFDPGAPHAERPGISSWFGSAKSFVVGYHQAEPGGVLERQGEIDEHLLILHDDSEVEIVAGEETTTVSGRALVFLPPGDSRISVLRGGRLVTASTTRSAPDLVARCELEPGLMADPNVPEYQPAGAPYDGFRIRVYDLDAEPVEGAFSAVWRCSSFLVLRGGWRMGVRDTRSMSPHTHVNFQQCNVVLDGEFRFNLRWPWVRDKSAWRPDEAVEVRAPGLTMTPAQALHTVEWIGSGMNHCIDLYAPPRPDFAALGWAINDAEYPRPS